MKSRLRIILLSALLSPLFFIACDTKKSERKSSPNAQKIETPTLILYGSNSCGHCLEFKSKLDSLNIKYKFNDVEQNQALAKEMIDAVHSVNYYDYIQFPVVKYGKQVFVNPELDQVLNIL